MQRLNVIVGLALICVASTLGQGVDPRGARPMEQGTRSEKCAHEKEWPFCTDDQWGSKCPSGCRIQGLIDTFDHETQTRVEKIRRLLDQNKAKHRSTNQLSKTTYDILREKLTLEATGDNNYYNLAQNLRQRISDMKVKIDRQLRILAALKDRVKDQVVEMQRLEVDIDIKLRSCKGSCKSYTEYDVDQESYVALEKQVNQLDSQSGQTVTDVRTLYVMKSRPLQGLTVDSNYKSLTVDGNAGQQRTDVFEDVKAVALVLESEGSPSSPATISKDSGTSYSSSSSVTSSKSITELRGDGSDGLGTGLGPQSGSTHHTSTSVSCTKTIKTVVTHTKDGPVEERHEVMEGGPECKNLPDLTQDSFDSLFPGFSSSSSSSSFSSSVGTKTSHSSGTKGSLLDTKTHFGNPFDADFSDDLGMFGTGNVEDDHPDVHARSLATKRTERQADYVGKDCVDVRQNHLNGETSGLFKIRPGGTGSAPVVVVYCQQEGLLGGWLLVQQRESAVLSFNRTWAEYRGGFGSVDVAGAGGFWLGNQNLQLLTSRGETMLRVELEDWEGGVANAEYTVRVGTEEEGYPLHVSQYTGDAGDALGASGAGAKRSHAGMKFSTFDRDNDAWEESCAKVYGGGWWYNNCQAANLNGVYYRGVYEPEKNAPYEILNGVVWSTFKPTNYSLKKVRMFIRPSAF